MGDTISRKAVIEEICSCCLYSEDCTTNGGMEKCKDVKWVLDLPTSQSEQEWIPLSEQLPEDGTWNIFTDGKDISVERYKMDALDHFWPNGRWFEFDKAIAWMPLPKHLNS